MPSPPFSHGLGRLRVVQFLDSQTTALLLRVGYALPPRGGWCPGGTIHPGGPAPLRPPTDRAGRQRQGGPAGGQCRYKVACHLPTAGPPLAGAPPARRAGGSRADRSADARSGRRGGRPPVRPHAPHDPESGRPAGGYFSAAAEVGDSPLAPRRRRTKNVGGSPVPVAGRGPTHTPAAAGVLRIKGRPATPAAPGPSHFIAGVPALSMGRGAPAKPCAGVGAAPREAAPRQARRPPGPRGRWATTGPRPHVGEQTGPP